MTTTKIKGFLETRPERIKNARILFGRENIFGRKTFAVEINGEISLFSSHEKAEAFAHFSQEDGTMAEKFSRLFISSEMDEIGNFQSVFNADPLWFGAKIWRGNSWDEIDFPDKSSINCWVNNGCLNTCVMPVK